jgi:hypothetical protein
LATRVGTPTQAASFEDHGVTRVGEAALVPDVQPAGRSDSRNNDAVPSAAVFGETGGAFGEDWVAEAEAEAEAEVEAAAGAEVVVVA